MLTSPVDKKEEVEEMDEDAAIAKVVRESCLWVKRAVSNIDVTPSIWLDEVQINKHKKEIVKKVSPSYVCRRCKRPGHHVKQCITNGDRAFDPVVVRGVAGIPRSFTVDLTPERMCYFTLSSPSFLLTL